jgi:tetratricopeptide (TPR) repeat protein
MTSRQITVVLRTTVIVLLVAVLGVAGLFGYTVYRDRQNAINSTPALRVIAGLRTLVKSNPNDTSYRIRLGEAYASATQYQKAIEQFNAALKIDPKHTGAYLDLGMVAMINKRDSVAISYFQKVVDLTDTESMRYTDSRRETALYNLGNMALDSHDYEKAVGYLKEALRIRKDSSDTYLLLARAFEALDDVDSAITNVEYALAFDPNYAQANYEAGVLYLEKKNYLKASEHIRRAIDNAPEERDPQVLLLKLGSAESWAAKAKAQLKAKPTKALEYIKIARRIDPNSAELALLHGQILEQLKKTTEALTTYKEAEKLDPTNTEIKAAVARLSSAETTTTKK